ncbi:AAA ATPase domain protein [Candidatus Bilamarchaeum dharawalense]|uniref:AAA ATPase domain protein n=1 Tax=Candidatus Bilamarchaeum dharawalense TaxID=2885759 RepID=A0A5E4LSQ3_9ARCH|nr:AAA ATPase domain protein [Candidatus Bilamarchaeum dharawalense]
MKGPNPFAWNPESFEAFGRKIEINIFASFINATASKQPGVLLIFGSRGTGKTTLLKNFKHEAERGGLFCPLIRIEKGEKEMDLIEKMFPDEKKPEDLEAALNKLDRENGSILFIDGMDNLENAEYIAKKIAKKINMNWNKKAVSVVMSSISELKISQEGARIIYLKSFDQHSMLEMIEHALGKNSLKMGDECLNSILEDSGGNPKLARMICWYVYEKLKENEKIITKGHYLAYLPYIRDMLYNDWFGQIYNETPKAEREILRALALERDGMKISEISKKLKKPLGPISTLAKRLLERGQIIRLERGKYKIFAPLYGRYVLQRS